jgi:hypothetical protein
MYETLFHSQMKISVAALKNLNGSDTKPQWKPYENFYGSPVKASVAAM